MLEYISHFEECYLFSFVPLFDFSLKKQNINPKKVYAVDTGLIETLTPQFSFDIGRKFENLVVLSLRRWFGEIYFYAGKGECDFLVLQKGKISIVIQA